MTRTELENLVKVGTLLRGQASAKELATLLATAKAKLLDAQNPDLSVESRFELAYSAAHALALAALWHQGFRSGNRITVFQCLEHTSGISAPARKSIISAHKLRNAMEYDADGFVSLDLMDNLIASVRALETDIRTRLK